MAKYLQLSEFHFHGTPAAAGNGKPIISPVRRSRMSAVGTESEDEVEEVEEPYEASIADDDEVLGHADDSLEEFFPGELAPGPPAAMTPDIAEGSEDEVEAPDEPVDGRLLLPEPKALDCGEAALRDEARTLRHMMTHTPKNPYCETCKCAKMYKPTKRTKGESLTVESNKFGDHIAGDHLVTRDSNEQSIDGEGCHGHERCCNQLSMDLSFSQESCQGLCFSL